MTTLVQGLKELDGHKDVSTSDFETPYPIGSLRYLLEELMGFEFADYALPLERGTYHFDRLGLFKESFFSLLPLPGYIRNPHSGWFTPAFVCDHLSQMPEFATNPSQLLDLGYPFVPEGTIK